MKTILLITTALLVAGCNQPSKLTLSGSGASHGIVKPDPKPHPVPKPHPHPTPVVKTDKGHGNGNEGNCRGKGCIDPDNPGKGRKGA